MAAKRNARSWRVAASIVQSLLRLYRLLCGACFAVESQTPPTMTGYRRIFVLHVIEPADVKIERK